MNLVYCSNFIYKEEEKNKFCKKKILNNCLRHVYHEVLKTSKRVNETFIYWLSKCSQVVRHKTKH